MKRNTFRTIRVLAFFTLAAILYGPELTAQVAHDQRFVEARLQELDAREQIRQLMHRYGRYLDERDFSAFADLFTETDSEYVSGGQTARGAEAIAGMLEEIITANPSGLGSPNFHVFFNEIIEVNGDEATAFSQSAFVVPDDKGDPRMVFLASYDDIFVKQNGVWKFKRRVVKGNLPSR